MCPGGKKIKTGELTSYVSLRSEHITLLSKKIELLWYGQGICSSEQHWRVEICLLQIYMTRNL